MTPTDRVAVLSTRQLAAVCLAALALSACLAWLVSVDAPPSRQVDRGKTQWAEDDESEPVPFTFPRSVVGR